MLCAPYANIEDDPEDLQRLFAATLHLMTAYAMNDRRSCPLLAEVISRHLGEISRAADSEHVLRATSSDLHDRWKLRAHVPQACPRRPWWLRVANEQDG